MITRRPGAPIAAPHDIAFAGTITLAVDATDTQHKVFGVRESIPVQAPGPMTLLYPAWESASHAETAAVVNLAGLVIRAETTASGVAPVRGLI